MLGSHRPQLRLFQLQFFPRLPERLLRHPPGKPVEAGKRTLHRHGLPGAVPGQFCPALAHRAAGAVFCGTEPVPDGQNAEAPQSAASGAHRRNHVREPVLHRPDRNLHPRAGLQLSGPASGGGSRVSVVFLLWVAAVFRRRCADLPVPGYLSELFRRGSHADDLPEPDGSIPGRGCGPRLSAGASGHRRSADRHPGLRRVQRNSVPAIPCDCHLRDFRAVRQYSA